jgi:hypothetical protein
MTWHLDAPRGGVAEGPPRRRLRPLGWGRADLHTHTLWSDGAQSPEAVVRAAARHLDVVAITDHDVIGGGLAARDYAREHPELGIDVVVGEEISTRSGHLIGLYLRERVPANLSAAEALQLVHEQGGLGVIAHPFHPYRGRARRHPALIELLPDLPVDGIEIVNNAGMWSWLYDALAALRNVEWHLPVTGGSDAHDVWYLGSGVTRFEGRDAIALRRALVTGRTRAHRAWAWTAGKVPRHLGLQLRSLARFLALRYRRELPGPVLSRRAT